MEVSSLLYILILFGINYFDTKELKIPNLIVIPSIFIGVYLTGNWMYAVVFFILGAYLFYKNKLCGGDLKLAVMVGAFMGIYSVPILMTAVIMAYAYDRYYNFRQRLTPFTPLVLIPSLFFIW